MSKKLVKIETDVDKLHRVSEVVDLNNLTLLNSIERALRDTFHEMKGAMKGLAAIQVGYPYQAILLRYVKGEEPDIVYNPEVLFKFGLRSSNEGCMSEGDDRYIVKRPLLIKVRYQTKYRQTITQWLPYSKARVFMHEFDHLAGILLQDKGILVESKK